MKIITDSSGHKRWYHKWIEPDAANPKMPLKRAAFSRIITEKDDPIEVGTEFAKELLSKHHVLLPGLNPHKADGFTLIELLTVCAVIAILASLILPAMSRAKARAQGIVCAQNQRQLWLAWYGYADDNHGTLLFRDVAWTAPNYAERMPYVWVTNDWSGPDNSLVYWPKNSPMWPYCPAKDSWKCPGNRTYPDLSQSMNNYVGGVGRDLDVMEPAYVYHKLCDFDKPANIFTFTDAREGSYSVFLIEHSKVYSTLPVEYHARAAAFVFADGHSEIHHWKESPRWSTIGGQDIDWVTERASKDWRY